MLEIKILIKDSYLAVIKNSVGSKLFCSFFVKINGKKKDVLENGKYSCAYFVSNILLMFNLIKQGHATVYSTLKDMEKSGWYKIKKPKTGCVIHWSLFDTGDGDSHEHLGFFTSNNFAVCTDANKKKIVKHKYNYRPIQAYYWHKKLD